MTREKQEKFRLLFDLSDDALVLFDCDTGQVVDLNRKSETLFGFPREAVLSQGSPPFMDPGQRREIVGRILLMKVGETFQVPKTLLVRSNGSSITCSIHLKAAEISGQRIAYCSIRDISSRILLEEKHNAGRARLIHADKMSTLGMLISGIAHEINNPNNFIMFNASLLSDAWHSALPILDDYYRENGDFKLGDLQYSAIKDLIPQLFSGLTEGSQRIMRVIENLREFARQDSGETNGPLDINRVILNAISLLNHEIQKNCYNFQLDADMNLPSVRGNAQQIEQVVINLLLNAIQSLPDPHHCVRVETSGMNAGKIRVLIRDEGCGMTPDVLARATEPFFTTKGDQCSGLGLAISATILHGNDSELFISSEPGKGTTATVVLNVYRGET